MSNQSSPLKNKNLEQQSKLIFQNISSTAKEYLPLSNFIKVKHGYAFKGDFITTEENNHVLVTPGNFNIGGGFKEQKCKYYTGDIPSDYILSARDLIVTMTDLSKDGDTLGYGAFVPYSNERVYLHNQRIGLVKLLNDRLNIDYIYWYLRSYEYHSRIVGSASGSTVKHTSPDRICEQLIPIPDDILIKQFSDILFKCNSIIMLNNEENHRLEKVRNTLLPKLMSGEIDVSEVRI